MLKIRLFRTGKKNQPSFKIVVTKKSNPPTRGNFKEEVGFYNPLTKEKKIKEDRIEYWLSVGAKPSDTVHNMLVEDGIIEARKKDKHKEPKEVEEEIEQEESVEKEAGKEDIKRKDKQKQSGEEEQKKKTEKDKKNNEDSKKESK